MTRQIRDPQALQGYTPTTQQLLDSLVDVWGYVNPVVTEVTTDYTAAGSLGTEKILCNSGSSITVDLPADPSDLTVIEVVRAGTGAVTIDGNGNTINGASTQSVASQYDCTTVEWFEDISEWIIK